MTLISITSSTTNIRILLNPIQDGLFRDFSLIGEGAKRIPTMMKLATLIPYLKRSQKNKNYVTHPLTLFDISIFSPEMGKFFCVKK